MEITKETKYVIILLSIIITQNKIVLSCESHREWSQIIDR